MMPEVKKSKTRFASMKPLFKEWFRGLEHRYEERPRQYGQPPTGIKNYFDDLFHGGDVVSLYARPKTGATALLLKLLQEFSESEHPVLYASSRTDPMNFITRLMTNATGIPLARLVDGQLFEIDWSVVTECASRLFDRNIYHADHYEMDPLEISKKMRLWRYQHNDHRGLLLYDDYADQSTANLGDFERCIPDLKFFAQQTNTLLVVTVKLADLPFKNYDLDRLFTFEERLGEQFAKRVVMKREEDKVSVRMMSCPEQSGRALGFVYNRDKNSLEYFL